ncbi:dimethylallyl tryptophan synthase GliD2 [Talaromyces proteolyticus]|uniref:Dimethylallyl tryptophan synthase GliD2 n=1 Tax=Talaromyces proteolyticus TaxID=1131652 RepID=A0AAD4KVW3_9EURO|nr:dimethylallyl tryptophan synthase GliD2 [Talaromyces proteolyticus]KAH8702192.1 dimethylallyl tryptophan synthase GliD2 [Talaromyces proteolyticus]
MTISYLEAIDQYQRGNQSTTYHRSIKSKCLQSKLNAINGERDVNVNVEELPLASLTPFDLLSVALPLPGPVSSTDYWWRKTGPIISGLLSKANYPLYNHYKHLLLYHSHILPLLGPRPPHHNDTHPSPSNAPWRAFLTDDFTPVEPSWNISGNESTIRLGVEPIGFSAGTHTDPFNQSLVTEFMNSLVASEADADLEMFEHFRKDFFIPAESSCEILAKLPDGEHSSQSFLAFDFDKGRVTSKAYFFPILKSLATGQDTMSLVSESILRLAEKSSWGAQMITAISVLEAWMTTCEGARAEMISVDCVGADKSRIKIYVRIPHTSLKKVKETYNLGGRLRDDVTTEGLKVLDNLWRTIFQPANDDDELPQNSHRTAGTIFNFELRPGKWFPEPKLYLPVRHYCASDLQIANRLQIFFGKMGWKRLEHEYSTDLQDLFPHHPLSRETGTHTYLSFSYKKQKGVYMTMYYNPKIYTV